jgi:ATP-dependent RNA helicase RhlE
LYEGISLSQHKRKVKALVVTPTRELAIQIGESFTAYGRHTGLKNTVIFGGVKQGKQVNALRAGVDIIIATPGRLLDLMNQGFITFRDLEFVVLDEADQMLDMGFIHDIKKIIAKLPPKRQSLFFSATMPKSIVELSRKMLGDFERVTIKP